MTQTIQTEIYVAALVSARKTVISEKRAIYRGARRAFKRGEIEVGEFSTAMLQVDALKVVKDKLKAQIAELTI